MGRFSFRGALSFFTGVWLIGIHGLKLQWGLNGGTV